MTQGHQFYILLSRTWGLRMVEPMYKELAIETRTEMDKLS
jgi:hypothetical protein